MGQFIRHQNCFIFQSYFDYVSQLVINMPYLQQFLQVFIHVHDSEENYTFIQQSQKQKMHAIPDRSTVYIEYCRACDTHSWCTHHDEGKYLSYFDKLATMITNEFPDINVVGNKAPAHLTPLTGYDNKFYNSKTKKYINFPAIGAFEVVFCGQTIFSKKKTNAWPQIFEIKKQIKSVLINGQEETIKNAEQSNNKSLQVSDEEENNNEEMATDKQTITFATNQYIDNDDVRTTFYKPKQAKSFTLTDHFKIYKMQKKQNERVSKDIERLEKPLSKIQVRSKKWEEITLKNPLSNFLKERAYINQEKGKREMIIDLHSIEEEVFAEENCVSKRQRGLTRNNLENREVMKQWDQQLNFLEHKFRKVESSLSKIKEKNKQFDSSIELEWLNRINQHKQHKENQPNKEHVRMPCLRHSSHSPRDQPKSQKDSVPNYLPAKLVKIDKYINSSQAYKNKKLHEIYGQWKIIKRNLNPVEPRYLSKRKQYTLESQSDDEGNNGRKKRKTQRKQRSNERDEKSMYRFDSEHDTQFPNIENKNKKFTQTMRQPYKLGGALESINAQKLIGKSGRQTPSHEKISNNRKITNKSPNWNTDAVRFVDRNYQIKMKSPQSKQDDIESIKTSTKQNRFFTTERCNRSYKQNEKDKQNSKDKLKKPLNHLYQKIGERNKMMQIQIQNGKDEQSGKQKKQSEAVSIRTQKKGKMNVLKQKVKQEMGNSKQDKMRKERIKKIKELKQQKMNPDDIYKLKYRGSLENQQSEQKQEDKQIDNFFKGRFSDEEELSQQQQKDDCELIQERSDENQAKEQQPKDIKDDELNCQKQEGKCGQNKEIAKVKINQKQVSKQEKETKNRKMVRKNEQKSIKQKEKKLEKQKKDKVKNNQDKPSNGNKLEQKEEEKQQKKQLQIERLNQLGTSKKVDKQNNEKRKKGQNQVLKNIVSKNSKVHSQPLDSKSQKSQNHAINKLKGIKKDRISGDAINNDKEQTKQLEGKIDGQGKNPQQQHSEQEQEQGNKIQDVDGEKNQEKEQLQGNNSKDDANQKLITSKQTENLNNKPDKEKLNNLETKDEQNEKCENHEISNIEQQKAKTDTVQFQKNKEQRQSKQLQRNTENQKENGKDQDGIEQEKHEKLDQMPELNKLSQKQNQQWKVNEQSKLEVLQQKQKLEGKGDDKNFDKKEQQNINQKPEQVKIIQKREDKEIYQAVTPKEGDKKECKLKIVQNCNKQPLKQTNCQEKEYQNQQRSINQFEQRKELSNWREQEKSSVELEKANKLENDIAESIANREDEDEEKIKKQPRLFDKDQIVTNPNANQKSIKEQQRTNQITKIEEHDHTEHQPYHNHKPENNTQELVKGLDHRNTSNQQEIIWEAFYKDISFCLQSTRNPYYSQPKIKVNNNKYKCKTKEEEHQPSLKTSIQDKLLVKSEEREEREGNKNRQQNKLDQVQKTEESDQNKQNIYLKTEDEQNKVDSEQKMQEMPNEKERNTKIVPLQKNEINNKVLYEKKQASIKKLEENQAQKEQGEKEKQGKELKAESDELKQQVPQKEETKQNGIKIEKDQSDIYKLQKQNGKDEQDELKVQLLKTEKQQNKIEKMVTNDNNCQKGLKIAKTDKDRSGFLETYVSNKNSSEEGNHNKQQEELIKVVSEYQKIQSEDIKLIKAEVNEQFTRLQELLLSSSSSQDNKNKSYKNINNVENLAVSKNQSHKKEQTNLNAKSDQLRESCSDLSKQEKQSIKDQQSESLKAEKEERVLKNRKKQVEECELTHNIQQVQIKSNEINNKQMKSDQTNNEYKLDQETEQKQLKGNQGESEQRIKQMQNQETINKHNDNSKAKQAVKEDNNKKQQQTSAYKQLIQQEVNKGQLNEHLKQENRRKLSEQLQQSLVKKQKQEMVDEQQNEENHGDKQQGKDVQVGQKKEEYQKQHKQIFKNKQKDINQQKKSQICDKKIIVQNQQANNNNKICNDGQDQPLQKKLLNPRPDLDLQKYHGNDHQLRQLLKRQSSINPTEKHLLSDKDSIYFQQKRLTSTPEFVIPQPEKISVGTQKNDVSDFGLQTGIQCQREVFLPKNNSKIEESLRKDVSIIKGYKMSQGQSQVRIISLQKTDEDKIHQRENINNSIEKSQVEIDKFKKQKQYQNESCIVNEQHDRKIQLKNQISEQKQQQPQKPKEGGKINKANKDKKAQEKRQKIDKNKNLRKQKNKKQSQFEESQSDLERAQNNDTNVNQEKLSSQLELKVKSQVASSRLTQINPPNDSSSSRALLIKFLYGPENQAQINIFQNKSNTTRHTTKIDKTLIRPKAKLKGIKKIIPTCQLIDKKDIKLNQLQNFNQLNNFHKALFIVGSINTQLITRLFQNPYGSNHCQFGVWLCDHFIWKCYVFDGFIPVDQKDQPFYTSFSHEQIWPLILQKALAIYANGYDKINNLQISKILHLLTGSNVLSYKIRQDPTKNNRLYSSIKKCLQKNYFVYCHKHDYNQELTSATYQLENIRKANNDEIVVHLKETKDGKQNKFWIKSEKFIQEFKSVDIVLLRQNSNNCRLSLKNEKGSFSIVCLDFEEDAQGSITISNKIQSGSIKVFLYRQQASNTLKLVGEAKEKDKNQLFFDCSFTTGKYYVFIETQCCESTISYTGGSRPSMYLKQQIKAEGYKNDFTQYLPISKSNKQNSLSSRLKRLDSKNQSLAKSKKPMSQVNIDILKQTFVRFLAATATQQAND